MRFVDSTIRVIVLFIIVFFGSGISRANAQCNLDFNVSRTKGCAPEIVKFNALGADSFDRFFWIVAGDTLHNRDTLVKLFFKEGSYSVSLTGISGTDTCTITKQNLVHIGKPVNSIRVTPDTNLFCNGPETVEFIAETGPFVQYDWIIEGKNYPDAGSSISHNFSSSGSKGLIIRATDTFGCTSIDKKDSLLFIAKEPKLSFGLTNKKGYTPLSLSVLPHFNLRGQKMKGINWQFQGGSPSSSIDTAPSNVRFLNEGTFSIGVEITTEIGCIYSLSSTQAVKVADSLELDFEVGKKVLCPGESVRITNTSKSGDSHRFSWKIHGGTIISEKEGDYVDVVFNKYGVYDVSLRYLENSIWQEKEKKNIISVEGISPDFTADVVCNCAIPQKVQFQNLSTSRGNGNIKYTWTFYDKDGEKILGTSTNTNPEFYYTSYGNYNVRLVAEHSSGCIDTVLKENFIRLNKFPEGMDLSFKVVCVDQPIKLKFPEDSFCTTDSLALEWIVYNSDFKAIDTFTSRNPDVKFSDSGDYYVSLKVQSGNGCVSQNGFDPQNPLKEPNSPGSTSDSKPNVIDVVIPKPEFKSKGVTACVNSTVQFEQETNPPAVNYTHEWTFVNSEDTTIKFSARGEKVSPKIPVPGIYHVKYRAYVAECCSYENIKENYLKVGGIIGDISYTTTKGCLPYMAKLSANVTNNYHFTSTSKKISYLWKVTPSDGAIISDSTATDPEITITKTGCYDVELTMVNSDGCKLVINKKEFICAGIIADFLVPEIGCLDKTTTVENVSFKTATSFSWISQTVKFSDANAREPELTFNDSGVHYLTLIAADQYGCEDSVEKSIYIQKLEADFSSEDTLYNCAPAYVSFEAVTNYGTSFEWDFGDGGSEKVNSPGVAHLYMENSGGKESGFDVKLKVTSSAGCSIELAKEKLITVVGPVPELGIEIYEGCDPLAVTFTNKSENFQKLYMDYGDKSNVDSNKIEDHFYRVKAGESKSEYLPVLVAKDKEGCYAVYRPDSFITVYPKPEARFTADVAEGCEPLKVKFSNLTPGIKNFFWDIDNDGISEGNADTLELKFQAGTPDISLIVENDFGCSDTITENPVIIYSNPVARIWSSTDEACPGEPVELKDASTFQNPLVSHKWIINRGNTSDTLESRDAGEVTFKNPGIYGGSLSVMDEKGCADTLSLPRIVKIHAPIKELPVIEKVTYTGSNDIEVIWKDSKSPIFSKYILRSELQPLDTAQVEVFSGINRSTTGFIHQEEDFNLRTKEDRKNNPVYTLTILDVCGNESPVSEPHQAAFLVGKPDGTWTNKLSWSDYHGWTAVKKYNVYRGTNNSGFEKIGEVESGKNEYTDKDICNNEFVYYVEAVKQNDSLTSWSNRIGVTSIPPDYSGIDIIERSTVENNSEILTSWVLPEQIKAGTFSLDRYEENTGWVRNYASVNGLNFTDRNVDVQKKNYQYRVRFQDICGNDGPLSSIGSNILLTAETSEDKNTLTWTPYKEWVGGVVAYRVERKNREGDFEELATIDGKKLSFTDHSVYGTNDVDNCYRVIALSGKGLESYSNNTCILVPSRMFIPNAFSPNGDGINDKFKISATSLYNTMGNDMQNYELKIFNRWGQMVFESNDVNYSWDGTFHDEVQPSGTYIYLLRAIGKDNKPYYFEGNVELIR